ncbi:MAG: GNAT family N-acetyltransferase [Hyphomonadaceae bacterium]|nr:GNAT family N-acetyltransferase [Hyphomonadaceae bacterium]
MTESSPREELISLALADAARMAALHETAFPSGQAWDARQFENLLNQESVSARALSRGNDILSFVLLQIAVDEAEILTLATALSARRRGCAARLLLGLEPQLVESGVTRWLLDVAEDNAGALKFYQDNGFGIDGRRRDYYQRLEGQRVDAILMSKPMARQVAT